MMSVKRGVKIGFDLISERIAAVPGNSAIALNSSVMTHKVHGDNVKLVPPHTQNI